MFMILNVILRQNIVNVREDLWLPNGANFLSAPKNGLAWPLKATLGSYNI